MAEPQRCWRRRSAVESARPDGVKTRGKDGASPWKESVGSVAAGQIGRKSAGFELLQQVPYLEEPDMVQLVTAPVAFIDATEYFYASEQSALSLVFGGFDQHSPVLA